MKNLKKKSLTYWVAARGYDGYNSFLSGNDNLFELTFNISTLISVKQYIVRYVKNLFYIQYLSHLNQNLEDNSHTLCSQTIV